MTNTARNITDKLNTELTKEHLQIDLILNTYYLKLTCRKLQQLIIRFVFTASVQPQVFKLNSSLSINGVLWRHLAVLRLVAAFYGQILKCFILPDNFIIAELPPYKMLMVKLIQINQWFWNIWKSLDILNIKIYS